MAKLVCVIVLLGVALCAQDPAALVQADTQQRATWAAQWLRSSDPHDIAWGAWLARQDRIESLVPLLVKRVAAYRPDSDLDQHAALLAVLDALIEMRANVPVKEARKLFPEFAAQSMILLVRAPEDRTAQMLDILKTAKSDDAWLAAGNVLVKTWPPGFAELLLGRFTEHLTVDVYHPGQGISIGCGGRGCYQVPGAVKQGWPSVGLYRLTTQSTRYDRSGEFLVYGDTPIYYFRTESTTYDNPRDSACFSSRDNYRAEYLSRFVKIKPYPEVRIDWHGPAEYERELRRVIEQHRTKLHQLVQAAGVPEIQSSPRLEVVIQDKRGKDPEPLPAVLAGDATLAVRSEFSEPLR